MSQAWHEQPKTRRVILALTILAGTMVGFAWEYTYATQGWLERQETGGYELGYQEGYESTFDQAYQDGYGDAVGWLKVFIPTGPGLVYVFGNLVLIASAFAGLGMLLFLAKRAKEKMEHGT